VFNGNGHKLTLTHQDDSINCVALFHTIAPEGVVRNLDLEVNFSGAAYIGGAAAKNYGTIENVTVDGTITGRTADSYAGGIAGYSGCKFEGDVLVPGRIIDCLNRANVTGLQYVGGIAGSFLGEMSRCGNEGTIRGSDYFGGLITSGKNVRDNIVSTPMEQRFIVSDCYNAGQVIRASAGGYFAGLIGSDTNASYMSDWRNDDDTFDDFKISNVFSYGSVTAGGVTIQGLTTSASDTSFNPYDITQIFSNTYYLAGSVYRLFIPSNLVGGDGLGTGLVKSVIKGKTAEEFASAEMAALLNNGRTGAAAPWEYVEGSDYPTLKAPDALTRIPTRAWEAAAATQV
jgi:hypothetical protein